MQRYKRKPFCRSPLYSRKQTQEEKHAKQNNIKAKNFRTKRYYEAVPSIKDQSVNQQMFVIMEKNSEYDGWVRILFGIRFSFISLVLYNACTFKAET